MLLSDEDLQSEFAVAMPQKEAEEETTEQTTTAEVVEDAVLETTETATKDIELESVAENTTEVKTETDLTLTDETPINISKYTDGEFEKIEDLANKYKELKENVITGDNLFEYLDKQSEAEFGMTFNEVMEWKNTDYSKMDSFDLLAEYEIFKDKDVTDVEIDAELSEFELLRESEEKINEMIQDEKLTQKEYDLLQAKFNKKIRVARTELTQHKDSLDLGKIKVPTNIKQQGQKQPTEEELNAAKELTKKEIQSLGKLKFNVGEKENSKALDLVITNEEKNNLESKINSGNWILDRWKNEDGTINRNKGYRDAYILENINKIVKTAYNEGIVNGRKEQVINEDNITLKDGRVVPNGGGANDITKMTEAMFG